MNIGNKLKVVRNAATSKAGLALLKTSKRSPSILFGAGVIGFGATVFMASKATLKLDSVLEESELKQGEAHDLLELNKLGKNDYTEKDYKKDSAVLKVRLVKDVARLYAPSVAVGVLTVGCLTGSHIVLNRRYAGVVAAYSTLDKSFKEYRGRVTQELGADADKKFLHGVGTREIVEEGKNGPEVRTVESSLGMSPYAKCFAKESTAEWSPQADYNFHYIRSQQTYANDMLRLKGYVFLSDVYKDLGFEPTTASRVVGWVRDNPRGGDNYIDFGLGDDMERFNEFMESSHGAIWLDFNVDGIVHDLLDRKI